MTTDYLISDVHIVNVTPRVPTKDLVALQCNLFTVDPGNPHPFVCRITPCTKFVWMDVNMCLHTPT